MRKLSKLMCAILIAAFLPLFPSPQSEASEVPLYVAFVLHMHQPIYHPGVPLSWEYFDTPTDPGSGVTVRQVFEDCGFCYRRPATLVNTYPEVRLTVHFTGSLIWQLDWLSRNGFSSKGTSLEGIWEEYGQAVQTGRLEVLADGFYHPIFPLIEGSDYPFQVQKVRSWVEQYFGVIPEGFYPPELAFSEEVVPGVTDLGFEWALVDSFHLVELPFDFSTPEAGVSAELNQGTVSAGLRDSFQDAGYALSDSVSVGIMEVNKWWRIYDTGYGKQYAVKSEGGELHIEQLNHTKWEKEYCELAFRPRLAEHDGRVLIIVPREHWLGQNQSDGFDPNWLIQELQRIQVHNTDSSRPFLVVIVSDGENGWMRQAGGGYYDWFWPGFIEALKNNGWIRLTTVSEYLREVYSPVDDYVDIETGSWGVGGANVDLSTWEGSTLDQEMWTQINEVRRRLQTYEQDISGSLAQSYMTRAWGYFAMAETSCYWFWDTNEWAQKSYTALELAVEAAENAVANSGLSGEVPDELGLVGAALPPDFGISVSPPTGEVMPGTSLNVTVSLVAFGGYENSVYLSVSSQPPGIGTSFSPSTGTPPFDSILTIEVDNGTLPGTYTLSIQGTGADGKEHTHDFILTITTENVEQDFSIEISPTSGELIRGDSTSATITLTPIAGYAHTISLSASGQPSEVGVEFNPENGIPPFDSAVTITVGSAAPVGTHTITVTGRGADGKEHARDFILTITAENVEEDFSIEIGLTSGRVARENSLTVPVSVETIGGYSNLITLSASGQPSGVDISFFPATGTRNFSSLMTIRAEMTAPIGTHEITVRGIGSDGKAHTVSYSLTITGPLIGPEIQNTRLFITEGKVEIACEVKGDVTSVVVEWSLDGEMQETPMSCVDEAAGEWVGELGPFETDTEINFSIRATGSGGEARDLGATGEGYNVVLVGIQPEAEPQPEVEEIRPEAEPQPEVEEIRPEPQPEAEVLPPWFVVGAIAVTLVAFGSAYLWRVRTKHTGLVGKTVFTSHRTP